MQVNRTRETTLTIGAGTISLDGPVAAHKSFADAYNVGDSFDYVIEDGDNYEIGSGTLLTATTISRDTIRETLVDNVLTVAGALPISLTGSAHIFATATAQYLNDIETSLGSKFDQPANATTLTAIDQGVATTDSPTFANVMTTSLNTQNINGTSLIDLQIGGVDQLRLADGLLHPSTAGDINLGSAILSFGNVYGQAVFTDTINSLAGGGVTVSDFMDLTNGGFISPTTIRFSPQNAPISVVRIGYNENGGQIDILKDDGVVKGLIDYTAFTGSFRQIALDTANLEIGTATGAGDVTVIQNGVTRLTIDDASMTSFHDFVIDSPGGAKIEFNYDDARVVHNGNAFSTMTTVGQYAVLPNYMLTASSGRTGFLWIASNDFNGADKTQAAFWAVGGNYTGTKLTDHYAFRASRFDDAGRLTITDYFTVNWQGDVSTLGTVYTDKMASATGAGITINDEITVDGGGGFGVFTAQGVGAEYRFFETDGLVGVQGSVIRRENNNILFQTRATTSGFVSTDYMMTIGASGVNAHEWRINNVATVTLNSALFAAEVPMRPLSVITAARPSAASAGAGAMIYDTTLNKPAWSDGVNWRDAAGAII